MSSQFVQLQVEARSGTLRYGVDARLLKAVRPLVAEPKPPKVYCSISIEVAQTAVGGTGRRGA